MIPDTRRSTSASRASPIRPPSWLLTPRRYTIALTIILALGLAVRLWNVARDVPTLNSDEAVVGLMALHLLRGEWMTFYWAQDYMGSLEAILAAPLIHLLGPTSLALRLGPLLASLGFTATVGALGARLYTRAVGLVSALLLALGTPFFLVMSARALGGYAETALMGAALLLLALGGARQAGRHWLWTALAGLLAGLGLWTNPLITPYLAVVAFVWWAQRRRDLLRWPGGGILVAGVVLGALPAIIYNITKPFATVAAMISVSSAGGGPHLTPMLVARHAWTALSVSLPVVAGAPFGGFQATGYVPADFLHAAAASLPGYIVSLVTLALGCVALAATAARLLRRRRDIAGRSASAVRLQGQAALLALGALYFAGFLLVRDPAAITSPRYLLPLYTLTPLVVGEAWLFTRRARGVRRLWTPQVSQAAVALVIALALVWNLTGALALAPGATAAIEDGQRVSGSDRALLTLLADDHLHTVITSGYWIGYRLAYESGESVIPLMRAPSGAWGYNRYEPYVTRGLADPAPAYVELAGTPQAEQLHALAQSGALQGYTVETVGGYVVATPPSHPPTNR